MISKTKVFIDPAINLVYSSYYIGGLYEVFGKKNVVFSAKYFKDLNEKEDRTECDSYIAIFIFDDGKEYRLIIDFGDDYPIRRNAYYWCDLYAKINFNPKKTQKDFHKKIYPIPPGFGIKIWTFNECVKYSISNLFKSNFNPHFTFKKHFQFYFSQIKALPINEFESNKKNVIKNNYVFFISSLWSHENCLTGTNLYRKMFIEKCIMAGFNFEGGFLLNDDKHPQIKEFTGLTFKKRIPISEFVRKTKQSVFVFNTPAVHNCHGWKLSQYLTMNKAIISTPLQNTISSELKHGENIHFVNDEIELQNAIVKIMNDDNYRKKLEQGSQSFYNKYVSPSSVIANIYNELTNTKEQL